MKKKKIVSFVVMVILALPLFSQPITNNYTNKMYNAGGSNAIVRAYNSSTTIVCHTSGNSTSTFERITTNVSTVPQIVVDVDTIYDIERYNQTIYFCGTKKIGFVKQAIMGYFDVDTFSTTNVYYMMMPWMKRLKKMAIASYANNMHVLMVGDENTGLGAIVDASPLTSSWDIKYAYLGSNNEQFEDITVIDSFVVATSVVSSNSTGNVWFFTKPASSSSSIFLTHTSRGPVPNGATHPVLLRRISGPNGFVVVTSPSLQVKQPFIEVHTFDSREYLHSKKLPINAMQSKLEDVVFDYLYELVNVLLYNRYNNSYPAIWKSEIYNINPFATSTTQSVNGHYSPDVHFTSLTNHGSGLAACGHNGLELRAIGYHVNTWVCMSKITSSTTKHNYVFFPETDFLMGMNIEIVPQQFTRVYKEEVAVTTCSD